MFVTQMWVWWMTWASCWRHPMEIPDYSAPPLAPLPSHLSLFLLRPHLSGLLFCLSYFSPAGQAEPPFVQVRRWRGGESGWKNLWGWGWVPDLWLWLFICNTLIISGELGGRMVGGGGMLARGLSSLIMCTCRQQQGDISNKNAALLKWDMETPEQSKPLVLAVLTVKQRVFDLIC